ncbi:MAG: NUDIX domain-containing protein [Candidatus Aenigmarchaeota archaeon]|nr:NUDIX domain-containing protein [Candidatus Aenigmarchaeota archaeon]
MDWAQFDRGVYLVNVLGIVYDVRNNLILIGRREQDPHIKELSWCFPGGRPKYGEDLEEGLKREIRTKTGLDVRVNKLIFARAYPERKEFLSLFYECEVIGGELKAGELFVECKWIAPTAVSEYFTTSIHPKIMNYLRAIEKATYP